MEDDKKKLGAKLVFRTARRKAFQDLLAKVDELLSKNEDPRPTFASLKQSAIRLFKIDEEIESMLTSDNIDDFVTIIDYMEHDRCQFSDVEERVNIFTSSGDAKPVAPPVTQPNGSAATSVTQPTATSNALPASPGSQPNVTSNALPNGSAASPSQPTNNALQNGSAYASSQSPPIRSTANNASANGSAAQGSQNHPNYSQWTSSRSQTASNANYMSAPQPSARNGQPSHYDDDDRNGPKYQDIAMGDMPAGGMNILILGETGVGKSTWINGFVNYIKYGSLAEAEEGELETLVASKFSICDEQFQDIIVSTGYDKNESVKTGQSATQNARIYEFPYNGSTIRLIDTPGIGDTRGIDQDKLNLQGILHALSHLDKLHGICILLKPNNSRVTVVFRFCIQELLTYLHKDASRNIVFCFTNSRGTFYKPGDTLPALKELLLSNPTARIAVNKETVYCYDSEAYRFLAAIKNKPPVWFPSEERVNFAGSWEKSIVETIRMLSYFASLEPHPIQSTINLNHVRQLIIRMTRPLAEISRNILTNQAILEDEKHAIEAMNENIEDLKKNSMTTKIEIETSPLDHPMTVCSNSSCVKIWNVGEEGTTTVEYVTICHEMCYLDGVTADSVGDPGLIDCAAMTNGVCHRSGCGHRYQEHLHIYYVSRQVSKQVENMSVRESINQNLSAAEMKQKMIDDKNQLLNEYEYEADKIKKASANFALYLKHNAITPYNDAMIMYLNHLIKEEEAKVANGGCRKVLDGLIMSKQSYVEEKAILDNAMMHGRGQVPDTPNVNALIDELKGLKHHGKALQDAINNISAAASGSNHNVIIQVPQNRVQRPHKSKNIVSKVKNMWNQL